MRGGRSDQRTRKCTATTAIVDSTITAPIVIHSGRSSKGVDMQEPTITVNSHTLTQAQAMTVRVALNTFMIDLDQGLGEDEHGRAMTQGDRARIHEIFMLMGASE